MEIKEDFKFSKEGISEAISFLQNKLNGLSDKLETNRCILLAEEYMLKFLEKNEKENSKNSDNCFSVKITVRKNASKIVIMSKGEVFDKPINENRDITDVIEKNIDIETSNFIQNILLKKFEKKAKYKNQNGNNILTIDVGSNSISQLRNMVAAIIIAILFGFVLNSVNNQPVNDIIINQLLEPIRNIFMNSLMIVLGPMIFFSIVTSISQYTDISVLGRIGIKTIVLFLFSAICSLAFSFILFYFIGDRIFISQFNISSLSLNASENSANFKSIIDSIVPNNFVKPFTENITLQIMLIAIFVGLATATVGSYNKSLNHMFESLNAVFMKIMSVIVKFIPIIVFCSISIIVMETGVNSLTMYAKLIIMLASIILTIFVYYLLSIKIFANVSPFKFLKKYGETALTIFLVSSSNACIPITMKFCDEKLGISKKIYSFIVPLGATINMTGTIAIETLLSLFIIKTYNISVDASTYFIMIIVIILSTMACPGLIGGAMIIFASLAEQLGFPSDALPLVLPFIVLVDMPVTLLNVTGDIVTSLIIAKQEKMIDNNVYNS